MKTCSPGGIDTANRDPASASPSMCPWPSITGTRTAGPHDDGRMNTTVASSFDGTIADAPGASGAMYAECAKQPPDAMATIASAPDAAKNERERGAEEEASDGAIARRSATHVPADDNANTLENEA